MRISSMVALLSRVPSLRLLARAVTFVLIALPLVRLAMVVASNITSMPKPAAVALLTLFGVLIAATQVGVNRLFKTIP